MNLDKITVERISDNAAFKLKNSIPRANGVQYFQMGEGFSYMYSYSWNIEYGLIEIGPAYRESFDDNFLLITRRNPPYGVRLYEKLFGYLRDDKSRVLSLTTDHIAFLFL